MSVFVVVVVVAVTAPSSLVTLFQLTLIEHNVMCRIVQGQTPHAIKEVQYGKSVKSFFFCTYSNVAGNQA